MLTNTNYIKCNPLKNYKTNLSIKFWKSLTALFQQSRKFLVYNKWFQQCTNDQHIKQKYFNCSIYPFHTLLFTFIPSISNPSHLSLPHFTPYKPIPSISTPSNININYLTTNHQFSIRTKRHTISGTYMDTKGCIQLKGALV